MNDIISEELPKGIAFAIGSVETLNQGCDAEQCIRAEFREAQRAAVLRFCEAINPKAMQIMETMKLQGPYSWESCQLSALIILRDELTNEKETK